MSNKIFEDFKRLYQTGAVGAVSMDHGFAVVVHYQSKMQPNMKQFHGVLKAETLAEAQDVVSKINTYLAGQIPLAEVVSVCPDWFQDCLEIYGILEFKRFSNAVEYLDPTYVAVVTEPVQNEPENG